MQTLHLHNEYPGVIAECQPGIGALLAFATPSVGVPANGTPGYAFGCVLINTVNGGLYVNIGTVTSCTFVSQDTSTLGFLPLTLEAFRAIASNDIPATAAAPPGGLLVLDTAPKYGRTNAATDKSMRIQWAATSVIEIQGSPIYIPTDMDVTKASTLNLQVKGANTDAFTLTANVFPGVGGSDAGGASTAYTANSTVQVLTVTIAANKFGAYPNFASIALTPSAHGTDALNLYAVWLTYTKRLLTA